MENNSNINKDNRERLVDNIHHDNVNHPKHYTSDPSGVECIDIVKHRDFCTGNAIKYLWRCGLKHRPDADKIEILANEIEDLKKSRYYINCKIDMLENKMSRILIEQDEAIVKAQKESIYKEDLSKYRLPLKEDKQLLSPEFDNDTHYDNGLPKPVELLKPDRSPDYIKDKIYSDMNEI